MATATAVIGFGTTFGVGDGASPEVFTVLAEVFGRFAAIGRGRYCRGDSHDLARSDKGIHRGTQ